MGDAVTDRVANPGSTLGEAIGALIEKEVNRLLAPIAQENGCACISMGRPNPRTGRPTKLLLKDAAGNENGPAIWDTATIENDES